MIRNRSLPCSFLTKTLTQNFTLEKCKLYTTFLPRALWDNALKETRQIASHKVHTLQLLILIKLFLITSQWQRNHEIFAKLCQRTSNNSLQSDGINLIQYRIVVIWLSYSVSAWSLGQHVCRFSPAIAYSSSFWWCFGNLQNHPVSWRYPRPFWLQTANSY